MTVLNSVSLYSVALVVLLLANASNLRGQTKLGLTPVGQFLGDAADKTMTVGLGYYPSDTAGKTGGKLTANLLANFPLNEDSKTTATFTKTTKEAGLKLFVGLPWYTRTGDTLIQENQLAVGFGWNYKRFKYYPTADINKASKASYASWSVEARYFHAWYRTGAFRKREGVTFGGRPAIISDPVKPKADHLIGFRTKIGVKIKENDPVSIPVDTINGVTIYGEYAVEAPKQIGYLSVPVVYQVMFKPIPKLDGAAPTLAVVNTFGVSGKQADPFSGINRSFNQTDVWLLFEVLNSKSLNSRVGLGFNALVNIQKGKDDDAFIPGISGTLIIGVPWQQTFFQ